MAMKVYVNLPVKDVGKTKDFFTKLGFEFDARASNEDCGCMIVGTDDDRVMFLSEKFFRTFMKKEICDTARFAETIIALETENPAQVAELYEKAIAAGARENTPPSRKFAYQKNFEDLDGHIWEIFYHG